MKIQLKNPLKAWREHRKRKADLKDLHQTASVFGSLETLMTKGLLAWNQQERRLYVAEPLAIVMLGRGADHWQRFLNNTYLYLMNKLMAEAWDKHVRDEQRKAVNERVAQGVKVNPGELDRIRRAVREQIESDAVQPPKIEPFEFFVINDHAEGDAKAAITYVGEYNPDTENFVMAAWDDVKLAIDNAKQK